MNYKLIYDNLVSNALKRKTDGYTELHHIIPKSMGGSDDTSNLVNLTAREHYVAHNLLHRIYPNNEMRYAFAMMVNAENNRQTRDYRITSRMYKTAKELNSLATSIRFKGKQKHNIGKIKCHDPISKKVKMVFPDAVPEGYVLGDGGKISASMSGKNKGNTYYYSSLTGETIAIKSDDVVPEGFVRGNPSASKGGLKTPKINAYDPTTGEYSKFYTLNSIPENWVNGTPMMWVNNGTEQIQINKITDKIPDGWIAGRSSAICKKSGITRKNNISKPINTPLGVFKHPLRFCEKYNLDISFFDSLDGKISYSKLVKNQPTLFQELNNVGYDFQKSKSDNGFYFIKDDNGKS